MQNVGLKADVRLAQANDCGKNMFDLVALRRGELPMDDAEGITEQQTEDETELSRLEPHNGTKRIYGRQKWLIHVASTKADQKS